jgi:acyl transferase domain-containing protein
MYVDVTLSKASIFGINLTQIPDTTMMFHKAGMLSADGRCKTLDASADGYVRGEFCGALCLESADADADVYGNGGFPVAVLGTAVNQDGRSSALTAPNGPAQQMVLRSALQQNALDGGDVNLLQMHGTGTPLGDPIEVGALNAVLMDTRMDGHPLHLAAGKSSMGHTEPGAGAAGLITSVNALVNALGSPILHLSSVNPHLHQIIGPQEKSKYNLPRGSFGLAHSGGDVNLVSGVSSFAFQGTNSHALLGCAPLPRTASRRQP